MLNETKPLIKFEFLSRFEWKINLHGLENSLNLGVGRVALQRVVAAPGTRFIL